LRRNSFFLLSVLILGVVAGLLFLQESDERRVRKTLDRMTEFLEISQDEHALQVAGKMRDLNAIFSEEVLVEFNSGTQVFRIQSSSELQQRILQGRQYLLSLSLSWKDVSIEFDETGEFAEVRGTLVAQGVSRQNNQFSEASLVIVDFRKSDEGWRVQRLHNQEPMEFR